jgi:hypothetical protein
MAAGCGLGSLAIGRFDRATLRDLWNPRKTLSVVSFRPNHFASAAFSLCRALNLAVKRELAELCRT